MSKNWLNTLLLYAHMLTYTMYEKIRLGYLCFLFTVEGSKMLWSPLSIHAQLRVWHRGMCADK